MVETVKPRKLDHYQLVRDERPQLSGKLETIFFLILINDVLITV